MNINIIIIIIIIIGKDNISFMRVSYTYIPEKNHFPKEYNITVLCRYCLWRPFH
jgi:hypothetical protein